MSAKIRFITRTNACICPWGENPVIIGPCGLGRTVYATAVMLSHAIILSVAIGLSEATEEIQYKQPVLGLFQEAGMLQSGRFSAAGPFQQEWVDHFGAYFIEEVAVNDRLDVAVGLGGIFQFQKPEVTASGWGGSQYKNFFVGPSRATLSYTVGKLESPWLKIHAGMFPFKYNPDAANLGEYLFRSNPYPNYIMTGGYSIVNNSGAYLQGANAEFLFGNLTLNLLVISETTMPPLYDWSVAGLAKYQVGEGLLELGAGVEFKRLIPVRPSRTTPTRMKNAYFQKNGQWYTGSTNDYQGRMDFAASKNNVADSAKYRAILDSVVYWTTTDSVVDIVSGNKVAYNHPDYEYFSSAGTVITGRFSLDLKKLFSSGASSETSSEIMGPADLKLYGEVALLGIKDYPVFYNHKVDRMPMMLGVNLPAFHWLDLFAVQVEYYQSPYINSTERVATVGLPQPFMPRGVDTTYSRKAYYDASENDNFSWSVLLKKEIIPGVTLYSQFARDHLRLVSLNTWFGPALESDENLGTSKDWYWMCQIGIGI
jgi:hypothetical protein